MKCKKARSNHSILFQLSMPRTGSNITCKYFGKSVDGCLVTPGIDTATGTPYRNHLNNALDTLPSNNDCRKNLLYVMEHSACLTNEHISEIEEEEDVKYVITVRDPSLVLESLVRKLVLDDPMTGIKSRIEIHVEDIAREKSGRSLLYQKLCEKDMNLEKYVLRAESYSDASRLILDSNAKKKGFDNWSKLQNYLAETRNYRKVEDILKITHPDLKRELEDYPSPQKYITENPFDFMRSCMKVTRKFIENNDSENIHILDSTLFRTSPRLREWVASCLGMQKEKIQEQMIPQDIESADIDEAAVVYMSRALSSEKIEKPFESTIDLDYFPSFLTKKGGLYWELVDHYIASVGSQKYLCPKNFFSVDDILNIDVCEENGKGIKLWERNPIFAYINTMFTERDLSSSKSKRLAEIEKANLKMGAVFSYIQKEIGCEMSR